MNHPSVLYLCVAADRVARFCAVLTVPTLMRDSDRAALRGYRVDGYGMRT